MLFTSLQYLVFLPIVVVLFWLSPPRIRTLLLLVASYFFYMSWLPVFIFLIVPMTIFNWFWGIRMHELKQHKKAMLTLGIATNLITLAIFKYANFFATTCSSVSAMFGQTMPDWQTNLVLPLGISFFTFEFVHYLFEIYRGGAPVQSPVQFALFAAFFPTQIAGPIKRYQDFLPQILEERQFKLTYLDQGLPLLIVGLAKKILIANNLAVLVDTGFSRAASLSTAELWLVAYAFMFQIYFDFSAYTDIARGSSSLFGYKVPINFNLPLFASNIADFWHRWHISLSTWLRDYLFIPLGGSRGGRWRTNWNIFVTFTLGGLWHGAAWNFVIWGMYHGLCLIVHREFSSLTQGSALLRRAVQSQAGNIFSRLLTFHAVTLGCVFFALANIPLAFEMLRKMFILGPNLQLSSQFVAGEAALLVKLAAYLTMTLVLLNLPLSFAIEKGVFRRVPAPLKAAYCSILVILMIAFISEKTQPFIYFQF